MTKSAASLLAVIFLSVGQWASADMIAPVQGKSLGGARGFDVEADLRNDRASFSVRVAVDRADRTYEQDDLMKVSTFRRRRAICTCFIVRPTARRSASSRTSTKATTRSAADG